MHTYIYKLEHRKAHAGIVSCFHYLIAAGSTLPRTSTTSRRTRSFSDQNSETFKEPVLNILRTHGALMVEKLINCLCSSRPAYGLDKEKGNPASVLWQVG
jgi:hypothetical protein